MDKFYKAQAARDARDQNYGDETYWDSLEEHARSLHAYYLLAGDEKKADEMLTRSLSDALRGNEGN